MQTTIARMCGKLCLPVLTFMILCGGCFTGVAQPNAAAKGSEGKSQRLMVTIVSVKPDMTEEYENFVRSETNPALTKGGIKWRDAWKTGMFGNSFEYVYVQPVDNLAEFDGPGPIERALGKEGDAAWTARSRKFLNAVRRIMVMTRPELSYDPARTGPPSIAVVSHVSVAPNRNSELEGWIKNDLLPVMKQANVPGYLVSQVVLGGDANEYVTLVLHNNYAELEKGPPVYRVMSKEAGDKLYQKIPAGTLTRVVRTVARYSPELSIRSAAMTATK